MIEAVGNRVEPCANSLLYNKQLIVNCVDAGSQHGTISFIFVNILEHILHNPCQWVEPMHYDHNVGKEHVPRVTAAYVCRLVHDYLPASLDKIGTRD